jgi:outer membrane protein
MMKNLVRSFFILVFISIAAAGYSQVNAKLGYIDSNALLEAMPGKDTVQKAIQDYGQSLQNQLQAMYLEYQTKVQDYQANSQTMSDIIKQTKEKELADMEARIQDFQQKADQDIQKKQQQLLEPLLTKAKKAIEEIARENGYTYIFDSGGGMLLYFEKGDNILPLVKTRLGLK